MDPADVLWMAFAVIFFTGLFFLAYKIFSLSHALTVRVPRNMRIAPSLPRELHRWEGETYPAVRPLASIPNVLSVTTYVKRDTTR